MISFLQITRKARFSGQCLSDGWGFESNKEMKENPMGLSELAAVSSLISDNITYPHFISFMQLKYSNDFFCSRKNQ